ncbi:Hypothetical predicted protein, partial [Olea europaea subsp. europaea]
ENPNGDFNFDKKMMKSLRWEMCQVSHISRAKTSSSGHHLVSGVAPKAPEHQNTLGVTMLASNPSYAERVTTLRSTL